MKAFLLTTGAIALLGFGILLADTKTDYDHGADFKGYTSYYWIGKVNASNQLWENRIRQAVDQQLSSKGLHKQQTDGDVAVAAWGRMTEQQSYNTFYDGIGGGWGWRGFGRGGMGTATTTVQDIPVGTLTVDLFDGKTKNLIWRGISTKTLADKPEKNIKKLDDAVADLFKKFPPKGES